MPLLPGTSLGPYRIGSLLGAGGMGEVYQAKDTRLGRDVAIKILPASFAEDPDRRARFEREAQAIAALSHPNVVAIFDTGIHERQAYVVMELLTGQTLRERLAGGSRSSGPAAEGVPPASPRSTPSAGLALRKAVDIAIQIARGLGAAHAKGIIHRDLKPENVFLLDDGQVKILDFGLARQFGTRDTEATRTVATEPGVVMGTIGYMAPEQVRGLATDARTDVFAFGAVLYEMLSGSRAFQRNTAADTMTAILTQEPPEVSSTRADTPPALDRIVRHCLEKNASERFESARDVAFALEALSGTAAAMAPSTVPQVLPATRFRWPWAVTGAVLVLAAGAATGAFVVSRLQGSVDRNIVFEAKTFDSETITNARFAPDGQTIVFSAAATGTVPSLYVVRPGEPASQLVAGPGTELLSVSSTGELAVLTGAKNTFAHRVYAGILGRMSMTGAVRPWLEQVTEADWSPDGSTLAVIRVNQSTWRIEYPVGTAIYSISRGYLSDLRVSPDGTRVAFFEHELMGDDRGWVKVVDRSGSGSVKTLGGDYWGEEGIAWAHDSRTVYFSAAESGGQSYQVRAVDSVAATPPRRVVGAPDALDVQDVAADGHLLIMEVSDRQSLRALLPGESTERELPWLDFAGAGYLSADGQHIAFGDLSASAGSDYAVAWRNRSDGQVVRLGPGWPMDLSPDGKWVLAEVPSTGQTMLYPTGPGEPITLPRIVLTSVEGTGQWMADGTHVWLCGRLGQSAPRCYRVATQAGSVPEPVTPEGVVSGIVAGDDRTVLAVLNDGTYQVMTLGATGPGRPARGITSDDVVMGWERDLNSVVVSTRNAAPARVERVDLTTGTRTLLKELRPADPLGVSDVTPYTWRDDGREYVYSYRRSLCQLFSVSGVGR